jgi:hypothetical protein
VQAPQSAVSPSVPPARAEPPPVAPIRPVNGASAPARAFDPEKASYQDYKRARKEGRF